MAISTGTVPVSPARDRIVSRQRPLGATLAQEEQLQAIRAWEAARGVVLVRVPVTVVGGFPGSLRRSQLIERAELTVSEYFFSIAEGSPDGFAIPVDDLVDLTIVPDPGGHMRALRVRYVADHESGCIQAFTLCTTGFRRIARFKAILRLVAAADVVIAAHDPQRNRPRSLAITWPHVRRFANELMVWSGSACGPAGGWLASARADCRVWMTTHSFFWCDVAGNGVNRVPVADMLDVTVDTGGETPVLAIAIRDGDGCRQDLLFGFDRREYGDVAESTCRSLANALQAHGVTLREEPAAIVPWRPGYLPTRPLSGTTPERPVHRLSPTRRSNPTEIVETAIPEEVLAWLDRFDQERLVVDDDAQDAATEAVEAAGYVVPDWDDDESEADSVARSLVETAPEEIPHTPWQVMAAWESACIAAIRGLESGSPIDGPDCRPAPALAALTTLIEQGEIDILDADSRARRIHVLAACHAALITLGQQQRAGIRSRSAILTERRTILARFESLTADA